MNKASAAGFGIGVIFLCVVVALSGIGNTQKRTAGPGKATPKAGESHNAGNEESAEVDGGTKPAEKKMVDFKALGSQPLPKTDTAGDGLKMARTATPGGYRTGQALDVIVSLDFNGKSKLTALAIVERLPKGWTFEEISGGAKPVIAPTKGATGELTFVWVQVPTFPCTVSYRIMPGTEVTGPQDLQGQAVYRQSGPELRTEMVKTTVAPAAN